jgi:hypothetical protein
MAIVFGLAIRAIIRSQGGANKAKEDAAAEALATAAAPGSAAARSDTD